MTMPDREQAYKVAFLHGALPLGGGEKVSEETAKYISNKGIASVFFATSWDKEKWSLPTDDSEVVLIPKGLLNKSKRLDFIISYINQHNIRYLFIVNNYKYYSTKIRKETPCKCIYWLHSCPDRKELDTLGRKNGSLRFYPKRLLRPLYDLLWEQYFKLYKSWNIKKERHRFDDTDGHIVLCAEYKKELASRLNLSEQEAERIFPIINTIKPIDAPNLKKKKEIVFVGRLSYADKRPDCLLDIWQLVHQELSDWSLKIYGSGKEEAYLRKRIEELGLSNVSLEGYVRDTASIYGRSAVLCLTSDYEGVPLVLMEAQNYGLVPIAFSTTSGISFLLDGGAGVLIAPNDVKAYADELKHLCLDKDYYADVQTKCLQKRLSYSEEANEAIWQKLLKL